MIKISGIIKWLHNKAFNADSVKLSPFLQRAAKKPPFLLHRLTRRYVLHGSVQTIIMNNQSYKKDCEVNEKLFEDCLVLNKTQKCIENRWFSNLDWKNEFEQDLVFKNCTICDSDFSNSMLDGLHLDSCHVFNCDFSGASLKNSVFEESVFYDKNSQKGCDFQNADLRHSVLQSCDISMSNFYRSELFDITINECQAQGCNFELADFVSVVSKSVLFSSARLTKSNFKYADFEGVYLEKCDLSESIFVAVVLSRANLEGANLTNTIFSPSQYNGLSLFKADLRNSEITGIDIRLLDFSGVEIFEWQMVSLMESIGFVVYPDP